MKFVIYTDYRANKKTPYEYELIEAADLLEAIYKADELWKVKTEDDEKAVYLMRIMQKEGKTERKEGYREEKYRAVLCRRSFGWHLNDMKNSESEHTTTRCFNKDISWFE
ncbi:MAG: hypothetical protein IJO45_07045 [Oscillospiraceae bacterium]|nr:hypothetical protein [Oscillospiraceae bacterium]